MTGPDDSNRPPTDEAIPVLPKLTPARAVTAATLDPELFGGRPPGRGLVGDVLVVAVNGHPQIAEASRELLRSLQRPTDNPMPPDHEASLQIAVLAGALGLALEHQGVGPQHIAELTALLEAGRELYRSPLGAP